MEKFLVFSAVAQSTHLPTCRWRWVGYLRSMHSAVDAIYEGGILRPLGPLPFAEHERVRVLVESVTEAPPPVSHRFASADLVGSYDLGELPATNERVREILRQRSEDSR